MNIKSNFFKSWIPKERLEEQHVCGGISVIYDDFGNEVPPPPSDLYYTRLPTFYQRLLAIFPDEYARAVAFVSALTCVSSALVNYTTRVGYKRMSPSLMAFIYGSGGQGKGAMDVVQHITDGIDELVCAETRNQEMLYKKRKEKHDLLLRQRSHRDMEEVAADDIADMPDPVPEFCPRWYKVGSKLTAASLEKLIVGAGRYPLLYVSTEVKTLIASNKSKNFGNLLDIFNKTAMEEPVTKDLSTDNIHIGNPQPRMALLVSGVHDDLASFFPYGTDDGGPSRWIFQGIPSWKGAYDDPSNDELERNELVIEESKELLTHVYQELYTHTDRHLELVVGHRLNERFNEWMKVFKEQMLNLSPNDDVAAMCNRLRILFRRLCMQFQLMKHIDQHDGELVWPEKSKLHLDEEVYDMAADYVCYNAKQHIHVYNHYLRIIPEARPTVDNSSSLTSFYKDLPEGMEFTIADAFKIAQNKGYTFSESKMRRAFATWAHGNVSLLAKRKVGPASYFRKEDEALPAEK